jgi:hypothetical protein
MELFRFVGLQNPPLVPRSASPNIREKAGIEHSVASSDYESGIRRGEELLLKQKLSKPVDKSLNKAAILRLEQQQKEKERMAAGPRRKASGITYTSNRSLHKR